MPLLEFLDESGSPPLSRCTSRSTSSKVIFLPAQNQTVQAAMAQAAQADSSGEGPSQYKYKPEGIESEYGHGNMGFQSAINAGIIENM